MLLNSLPNHLKERVRTLSNHPVREDGEWILYWMHHAVRDHENPALDVAIHIASTLNIPLLVYQGLAGAHPYNSDRHFTFILEGAKDVADRFKERGIRYEFYLGPDASSRSPLYELGQRAAMVITEDYPAPPFPRWTRRLVDEWTTPVWAVDSHCIVPMQHIGRWYSRAYHFRNKIETDALERAASEWPELSTNPPYFSGVLPEKGIDWGEMSISERCAQCDIDHSIGPIHHTKGGSTAGYARWDTFLADGLKGYDKKRNDPTAKEPAGVSRLSAYLHYGHVSPFRIARDAVRDASSGAQKFLDELLVWRELAFNLCFHNSNVTEASILPQWVQDSFERHLSDEREALYSWEALSRSQTADPLWNLAQQSLRIHGELHNNVRMTWGKAVLQWTNSPQRALDMLLDLNHRYALDGSDPNSYAGILWCLGLLDRPFPPEKPILGLVRPRSSSSHQSRINMDEYERHLARYPRMQDPRIAIIGAGIAGLTAARTLKDHGFSVTLFDRGRKPGGRTASVDISGAGIDLGAPTLSLKDPRIQPLVTSWRESGLIQDWQVREADWSSFDQQGNAALQNVIRQVASPSMRALSIHLAQGLEVKQGSTIVSLELSDDVWRLQGEDSDLGSFDVVLVAGAAPQAIRLLGTQDPFVDTLKTIETASQWTVGLRFGEKLPLDADLLKDPDGPIGLAIRESSKPGRPPGEYWALHASRRWAAEHVEEDSNEVASILTRRFLDRLGLPFNLPVDVVSHRWRFGRTTSPLNASCHWEEGRQLGFCGDYFRHPSIEGALLSGMAVAGQVMGSAKWSSIPERGIQTTLFS